MQACSFPKVCTRRLLSLRVNAFRWGRTLAGIALLGAALAGCERPAEHPALTGFARPPPVPAYEFVYNRHSSGGFLFSPDGTRLAWMGPSGWRKALHVRSEVTGKVNLFKTGAYGQWSADSRH